MKNMKRILALLLAVLMMLSVAAVFASCGKTDGEETQTEKPTESRTEKPTETATEEQTEHVHTNSVKESKEATCTEAGYTIFVCSACGAETREDTPVLDHDFDDGKEHAATCGVDAYTEFTCRRCGGLKRDFREGTATGEHIFGDKPTYVKDKEGNVYGVCTVCGFRKLLSEDELRQAIYDSLPDFTQEVVAFVIPDGAEADSYVNVFELMKDAGITAIVSCCQTLGSTLIPELLDACTEAGMDVYLNMHGMSASEMVYKLDTFAYGYDCIRGIYLKDEPVVNMFEGLAEAKRRILEEIEGASDWLIAANMLPYGDKAYEDGDFGYGYVSHGWYNTLVEYAETVKPDFICFDRYPWDSNGNYSDEANTPNYYVANLLVAKKVADQFGLPLATYLQTVAVGGYKAPTETQFRCEVNLSLACGADMLFLFTAYEGHRFSGFISNGGKVLGDMYYTVETVMAEVNAMKGIYDLFDLDKVMTVGCDEYDEALKDFSEAEEYLTDSYGKLAGVETEGKCFIGCMKDDAGREGYYIVNNQFRDEDITSYVLTFTEETTYQLWTMEGLVATGKASTLTLDMMCGEGLFLVLGGENVPMGVTKMTDND